MGWHAVSISLNLNIACSARNDDNNNLIIINNCRFHARVTSNGSDNFIATVLHYEHDRRRIEH